MKLCDENNDTAICLKGYERAQSFVLLFTLQLNILTGTFLLLRHISKSIVVCAWSRTQMLTIEQRILSGVITIAFY